MLKQNNNLILEDNSSVSASDHIVHATSDNNNKSQYLHPPPTQSQPLLKKKRNLPGNPDPEAEVISLSPKTLMATNRFICEVCNKGFQRDQNLQLHRRGHNLPWKLKQRNKNEVVRKKVYVCPEVNCVHHEPSRALGDLTGIKKHFSRKHGEKKWKCDKCSKRYAVQSDWKAHSKTCGTKEYKCDCGTLFSRRDSFITHRAFCDALAEESARAITGGGIDPSIIPGQVTTHFSDIHFLDPTFLKKEDHQNSPLFPSWLLQQNNNNNNNSQSQECSGPNVIGYHPTVPSSAYMSATALLQKAAQMGTTHLSKNSTSLQAQCTTSSSSMIIPQQQYQTAHVSVGNNNGGTTTTTLSTSSLTNHEGFADVSLSPAFQQHHLSMTMMMMNNSFADVATFEDEFSHHLLEEKVDKGMTRDFLGLKPQSSTHQPWHIDMQGN